MTMSSEKRGSTTSKIEEKVLIEENGLTLETKEHAVVFPAGRKDNCAQLVSAVDIYQENLVEDGRGLKVPAKTTNKGRCVLGKGSTKTRMEFHLEVYFR